MERLLTLREIQSIPVVHELGIGDLIAIIEAQDSKTRLATLQEVGRWMRKLRSTSVKEHWIDPISPVAISVDKIEAFEQGKMPEEE